MRPALPFVLALLGAFLPAQTPRLGLFPEPFYEIAPALDRVLRLDSEQVAKIDARSAPLRAELAELERQAAAAEPADRARLVAKLDLARAEIEPALRNLAESALGESQKRLVALMHELHSSAVLAAADELAARAKKGRRAKLDNLVREQLMASCPGLESSELEQVEAALQGAFVRLGTQDAAPPVAPAPAPAQQQQKRAGGGLLEALASGALEGLAKGDVKKPKDALREVAEAVTKAAADQAVARLREKLRKEKPERR